MFVLIAFWLLICATGASRILGVSLTPSHSHHVVFQPLWRELSLRGHQVTTITPYPIKDSKLINLTEIEVGVAKVSNSNMQQLMSAGQRKLALEEIYYMYYLIADVIDHQLENSLVKTLIADKDAKFDLVVVEYLWTTPLAFAKRFDCPYIGILSVDGSPTMYAKMGNPTHPSLYPDYLLPFGDQLSLIQRVVSFLFDLGYRWYLEGVLQEIERWVIDKHFGAHYPPTSEMVRNISMLFVNTDPIFHPKRPLVPAVVQIGGGSRTNLPKPLPKELRVLDDATNGFIYFSLGSNVKSEFLRPDVVSMMAEVFEELPYMVLWKYEEELPKKLSNVIVSKWVPQRDVLGHPNIKLFITQGGLQSIDEAISARVPMVGIPIFFDQPYNVNNMANRGFGIKLDPSKLEKKIFKEAILEVINNPRYRNTLKELAELREDQPMTGIERAVWWTEYVIRHKGAKHLRSPLLDVPLYQYLLLDVIAVLLLSFFGTIYLITLIYRLLVLLIKWTSSTRNQKKKKL